MAITSLVPYPHLLYQPTQVQAARWPWQGSQLETNFFFARPAATAGVLERVGDGGRVIAGPRVSEQPIDAGGREPEGILTPGSRADFDHLYRRSYGAVVATLVAVLGERAAAEDCAQEAFVRAFRAWDRWRPDAPPEAWLHRIAINVANSYRQRQKLGQAGELVRRIGRPREAPHPEDIAAQNEVMAALSRLPPEQAGALVLRHYHGYTNREIAHAIGVPERTIASRLARAKEKLRAILGEVDDVRSRVDVRRSWLDESDG
jgi:RNA polymerase sigma-70 factor (ECF subfamily)